MLPGRSASIRKFVSRWITELDTLPSGFRDGLLPCSGTSLGQAHCLLQLAENFQQILRSLRHGQRRILHSTLHCFLRRHTPSLTQATERSCCHLIKINSQCRMSHRKTLHASAVSDNTKREFSQGCPVSAFRFPLSDLTRTLPRVAPFGLPAAVCRAAALAASFPGKLPGIPHSTFRISHSRRRRAITPRRCRRRRIRGPRP